MKSICALEFINKVPLTYQNSHSFSVDVEKNLSHTYVVGVT